MLILGHSPPVLITGLTQQDTEEGFYTFYLPTLSLDAQNLLPTTRKNIWWGNTKSSISFLIYVGLKGVRFEYSEPENAGIGIINTHHMYF